MAKRTERGSERQKNIQRAQHRPEQNAGYDEAVRGGGPAMDLMNTAENAERGVRREDAFDRAERKAAADVRRRERSAN